MIPVIQLKHEDLVHNLAKPGAEIVAEMTPLDAYLLHMAVGISGEAGELLDAIKRGAIYKKDYDLDNIKEELGDLEFYMEGLRQKVGLTREECLEHNITKLTKRYGQKYSNEGAQLRKDKSQ